MTTQLILNIFGQSTKSKYTYCKVGEVQFYGTINSMIENYQQQDLIQTVAYLLLLLKMDKFQCLKEMVGIFKILLLIKTQIIQPK